MRLSLASRPLSGLLCVTREKAYNALVRPTGENRPGCTSSMKRKSSDLYEIAAAGKITSVTEQLFVSRSVEALLQRFALLSADNQFLVYELIGEQLAADKPLDAKAEKAVRRGRSLAAIARVAAELQLPPGVAPTTAQFDAASSEERSGLTSGQVIRAWGRWRFAQEAFLREPAQRFDSKPIRLNAQSRLGGTKRSLYEDPLTALRLWLATCPNPESLLAYDAWVEDQNAARAEHDLPMPPGRRIPDLLGVTWRQALQVAKGEANLDELPDEKARREPRFDRSGFNLVSIREVAEEILGVSMSKATRASHAVTFPPPSRVTRRGRLWRRGDVEAYAKGRSFPTRAENDLAEVLLEAPEAAKRAGVKPSALTEGSYGLPSPTVSVGRMRFWAAAELDEWRDRRVKAQRRR